MHHVESQADNVQKFVLAKREIFFRLLCLPKFGNLELIQRPDIVAVKVQNRFHGEASTLFFRVVCCFTHNVLRFRVQNY